MADPIWWIKMQRSYLFWIKLGRCPLDNFDEKGYLSLTKPLTV